MVGKIGGDLMFWQRKFNLFFYFIDDLGEMKVSLMGN